MALKRSTILFAAFATLALVAADAAPSFAQSVAPTRTTPGGSDGGGDSGGGGGNGGGGTPTRPGGNDGGGTEGGGGSSSSMPSYGCSGYGWANMPAYCVTAAMACACPTETSNNYRKPASCGSITPNQRKAAERQCYQASKVSYRPRS